MTSKKIYSEHKPLLLGSSLFLATLLFFWLIAFATASVTTLATGGSAISADTTGGTYTTLTGPVLSEGATGDVGVGTIILNVPTGFAFRTTANSVTATVTDAGSGCTNPRRLRLNGSSSQTVTPTATTITITVSQTSKNSCRGIITWSGIAVRPTSGTPLASGNITRSGTSAITGVTTSTNFGTLTEVAGAKTHLTFTTQPSTSVLINTDITTKPIVAIKDQFENTVTSDNSTTISLSAKLSSQTCTGTNGSGVLTTTPSATGATVISGVLTYSALQYSYAESIKLCAVSTGITSALSNAIAVNNPQPTTTTLSPSSATAGGSSFTLTVDGTNFISSSVILWGGSARTTTYVSPTRLTATISASDITTAGTISVAVNNPLPGGGTSNAQTFTINNPLPVTTSLSPSSAIAGDSGFTLTVHGTGFTPSSNVLWGGSSRATTYISSTTLITSISSGDIASAGSVSVTVNNPLPGGGISNSQTFTINVAPNPIPTTTSLSPSSAIAGDPGFTLTVDGTNFINGSVIRWGGLDRATTYVSPTRLTATISASDISTARTISVAVYSPLPGGGLSNTQTFTVNEAPNPLPTTTSISPSSATAGGPAFTLTINGTGFISSSTVLWGGLSKVTTYVSPTTLTASILADDISTSTNVSVAVSSPLPGGGVSNTQTFEVVSNVIPNPVPVISSISPDSKTIGDSDFTMSILGSNFIPSSTALVNGITRTTTFLSSGELSINFLASELLSAGTSSIEVFNSLPGGGTSSPVIFTVSSSTPLNPLPILSQLLPNSKMAGALGFTMSILGSNFIPSSIVLVDNIPRSVTYFSPTKLLIDFLTSELTSVITYTVNVVNPPLGGGTSTPLIFSVTPASTTTPEISSINPTTINTGSGDTMLTVLGSNFTASTTIRLDGADQPTTFVSSGELTTIIPSANLAVANPGILVTVYNYEPVGEGSNSQILIISDVPVTPPVSPSAPTTGGTPDLSVILFTGQAFPGASVTIIDNDTNTGTQTSREVTVQSDGTFREPLVGVNEAFHGFALVVKDKDGRLARTKYFTLNAPSSLKKAIEVEVPPTLEIASANVRRGDNLIITGYAAPNHIVRVDVDSVTQPDVKTESSGLYKVTVPTSQLEFGKHDIKVSQTTATSPQGAILTDYSNTQSFTVSNLSVPQADLNDDGVIDAKDLGVFFSRWISTDVNVRKTVDINNDDKTDLTDFSILIRAMQK